MPPLEGTFAQDLMVREMKRNFSEKPSREDIESTFNTFISQLRVYDKDYSASIIAGLFTFPKFQANTIRLEFLQYLICNYCRGHHIPTKNRIGQWLNLELNNSFYFNLEDPVEDVFISNVITGIGNSRIFEGVEHGNDFWLQQTLNALNAFEAEGWARQCLNECDALLAISNLLAERCKLTRNTIGYGAPRAIIDITNYNELVTQSSLVFFSWEDLANIGISSALLGPLFQSNLKYSLAPNLSGPAFIQTDKGILVTIACAISPTLRFHIVESAILASKLEEFEVVLQEKQLRDIVTNGLKMLDVTPCTEVELPLLSSKTTLLRRLFTFDSDKYVYVLVAGDSLSDLMNTGFRGLSKTIDDDAVALSQHCEECSKVFGNLPGCTGGLIFLIQTGVGRGGYGFFNTTMHHWYFEPLSLYDFWSIACSNEGKMLGIWQLREKVAELSERRIGVVNLSGWLNLYGHFHQAGFRIMGKAFPDSDVQIHVETNCLALERWRLRNQQDVHAVAKSHPDEWVPVRKFYSKTFFEESFSKPLFVDYKRFEHGEFRGVYESVNRTWWVTASGADVASENIPTVYKLWETILSWLAKLVPIAEKEFNKLAPFPIEIFLEFEGFKIPVPEFLTAFPPFQTLSIGVDTEINQIRVKIPFGFIRLFADPTNIAERTIIEAILKGASLLNGMETSSYRLKTLSDEVTEGDQARYYHLFEARSYRQNISPQSSLSSRLASNADYNHVCLGIGRRLTGVSGPQIIRGKDDSNKFLHAVTVDCKDRILSRLRQMSRESVVMRCLENIEAIEIDKFHWQATSAAMLATHIDQTSMMQVALEKQQERTISLMTSRVLVEMALCTSPVSSGRKMNSVDLDYCLALLHVLIMAATSSDAINSDLTEPMVEISNNGEFTVDARYVDEILRPYMDHHFGVVFNHFVDYSSDLYPERLKPVQDYDPNVFTTDFRFVLKAEYGLSPEELIKFIIAVDDFALEIGSNLVIKVTNKELETGMMKRGISSQAYHSVLKHFSLCSRPDWGIAPEGFKNSDWYPWRYRRRLSLVARPIVQLTEDADPILIVTPGLLRDSIQLLIERLLTGRVEASDFSSPEMQAWVGTRRRILGEEFEQSVSLAWKEFGYHTSVRTQMTALGGDRSYGDVDILAWNSGGANFFVIECKRLHFARTPGEIGEQLKRFSSIEDKSDSMKHVRRCEWLRANPLNLVKFANTKALSPVIHSLLVTETTVPMQFCKALPIPVEEVVPFCDLKQWIAAFKS